MRTGLGADDLLIGLGTMNMCRLNTSLEVLQESPEPAVEQHARQGVAGGQTIGLNSFPGEQFDLLIRL